MRPAIRQLLDAKREEKKPRKLWERHEISEEEGDQLLAKHAPNWLEHLYRDDGVLEHILYALKLNERRRTT
jgi:hypothetical protein